ncbi:MAG: DUF6599 family protein [Candidatus Zhuqueibacterota bacterium]
MLRTLLIGFLLSLSSPLVAGIDLPGNDVVPGWSKSGSLLRFPKEDLFNHINGGAELFLEFGFVELQVQPYQNGSHEIVLEAYQMECPEAALGIYLMKCGKETPLEEIAARNSGNTYQVIFVQGDYFIQLNNFDGDDAFRPVLVALAQAMLSNIPETPPVDLLRHLPKFNLVPGSELIIRGMYGLQPIFTFGEGDILQLQGRNYGVVGDYIDDQGKEFTQIITLHADSIEAKRTFEHLRTNLDPYLEILETSERAFTFKDFKQQFGLAECAGSRIHLMIHLHDEPKYFENQH